MKSEERRNRFCQLAYPRHPSGCPNYGNCDLCPPNVPIRYDVLKKYDYFRLVILRFKFGEYRIDMERETSENRDYWTENRISCVLYYQSSIKRIIEDWINKTGLQFDEIFGSGSGLLDSPSMEASGIFVFSTLKRNKVRYQLKPLGKRTDFFSFVNLLMSKNKPMRIKELKLNDF